MKTPALFRSGAVILSMAAWLIFSSSVSAADWPTFMRDNARVGATDEELALPLREHWRVVSAEAPRKGNTGPQGRIMEKKLLSARITFDDAFHAAVVGERLYYGSSVDHQMRCLDVKSGEEIWTFYTGGAVRLAPTVFEDRVYFGSDDGFAYCLDAKDGRPVWKRRAGPNDEMILGRGEMISRWPVRTGILVVEGKSEAEPAIAYFGAGIFPHELIYLYALDARTGEVVWKLDHISQESAGRNDLSPQGYFLANDELLVIPSGRSLPAVLDRMTGKKRYKARASWRSDGGGVVGGTQALLSDDQIYVWGAHHILAIDQEKGKVGFGWFAGHQMAVAGDAAYVADGTRVARLDRAEYAVWSGKKHDLDMEIYMLNRSLRGAKDTAPIKEKIKAAQERLDALGEEGIVWSVDSPCESRLVVAGKTLFAGGEGQVAAFDVETGKQVWSAKVDGEARGLVVANGCLVVSTTTGDVHCFRGGDGPAEAVVRGPRADRNENPYVKDGQSGVYRAAAKEILETSGIEKGYRLVAGSERGRLAFELAKRSELEIYCVEPDPAKVRESRALLSAAGVYGSRVTVHHASLDAIPYSNYFANLIVSDAALIDGELSAAGDAVQLVRHLKPLGGVACVGRPKGTGGMQVLSEEERAEWLAKLGMGAGATLETEGSWTVLTRGALPGAGSWTHQYGEPGNTAASDDERVKGGLGVLWFGDPGEGEMVNRHEGAVGPLAVNGRLFVQGQTNIMAYDAYNGMFLWERNNENAIRTGVFQNQNPGNLAASDFRLYFMEREKCHEIDAATGELVASHRLPEKLSGGGTHEWGYVAFHGGKLFGTATMRTELEEKQRRRGKVTEDMTDGLFAIDGERGAHLWDYRGGTIAHHTIAIGEDAIYFIDSTITSEERAAVLRQDKSRFTKLSPEEIKKEEARLKEQDLRLAVAVDANTGEVKWSTPVDVTDCSDIGIGGGKLTLIYKDGVLLLGGANANGHYWKQFMAGEFAKRRLVALDAKDGSVLWKKDANYRHRPIVANDEVFAEPWAFDLRTGEQKMRTHPITGDLEPWSIMRAGHHCGMMAASPHMLMFRSGFTGFYDLDEDIGTRHFAGHRTGCWINAIPANGLVSIPEASAGCVCLFSVSSTIVMEPRAERRDWSIFSSTGAKTPVKRMALNLGAPGDRRAEDGTPWLAYPRPKPDKVTSLDLALDLKAEFYSGGDFVAINSNDLTAKGEEPAWVHGSWASGLKKCAIPLLGEGDAPAKYTVRLHFFSDGKITEESRAIDVAVQGKKVLTDFGRAETGLVTREVSAVAVKDELVIEVSPTSGNPSATGLPLLTGIEVVRM